MSRKGKLAEELKRINEKLVGDKEELHKEIDKALLRYIDDREITDQYNAIVKWYG